MNESPFSLIIQDTKAPMNMKGHVYRSCKEDGCRHVKEIFSFTGIRWTKIKRCGLCPQETHNIIRKETNIRQSDIRQWPKWRRGKVLKAKGTERKNTLLCVKELGIQKLRDTGEIILRREEQIFSRHQSGRQLGEWQYTIQAGETEHRASTV